MSWTLILTFLLSYLLGSIPSALILGKLFKNIDIREHGSGNLGTTNAMRILGKKIGIAVLVMDIGKGSLAALLPYFFNLDINPLAVGIFAIIGHALPVFANFRGGKSVATTTGIIIALNPLMFAIGFLVFLLMLLTFRFVSLASIVASIAIFISSIFILDSIFSSMVLCLIAIFITYKHRANIKRIINKEEPKMKFKKRS